MTNSNFVLVSTQVRLHHLHALLVFLWSSLAAQLKIFLFLFVCFCQFLVSHKFSCLHVFEQWWQSIKNIGGQKAWAGMGRVLPWESGVEPPPRKMFGQNPACWFVLGKNMCYSTNWLLGVRDIALTPTSNIWGSVDPLTQWLCCHCSWTHIKCCILVYRLLELSWYLFHRNVAFMVQFFDTCAYMWFVIWAD